ncbi:MAG: efflux RND transporter periplasmic adaptor subunit [Porticoccaceae bacterium]|nr:efflux RND transporter periplasmic adaptor subunit [Porticoccaceae bacterium]
MNSNKLVLALLVGIFLVAGGVGLYQLGVQQGAAHLAGHFPDQSGDTGTTVDPSTWSIAEGEAATRRHIEAGLKSGQIDPFTGRKILYYQDPMMPGKKFESPGKSPYMDMMLVPVYGGGAGKQAGAAEAETVTISPRIQQNIGMRTAPAAMGTITPEVVAVGTIAWNERDQVNIQARALGYVEKLHVDARLDTVTAGQPLLDLYVPGWVAVQEEFLAVQRMAGAGIDELLAASRSRMRQSGMTAAQIRLVETTGSVQTRLTLKSPVAGVVTELYAREGMTVTPGQTMVRINDLDRVWVDAEIPESQAALLEPGDGVKATTPALPGIIFSGAVDALLPEVSPDTRTLKARMVLDNSAGRLAPGMFVDMRVAGKSREKTLLVPSAAVIRTGKRSLVMVAEEGGYFRPVEVITGLEANGQIEIRQGLQAGQGIVVSGQFLVDSEASLQGVEARLGAAELSPGEAMAESGSHESAGHGENHHVTQALVEAVQGNIVTLTHPKIPSLQWPAMTMDFGLAPELDASTLAAGQNVEIEFRLQTGAPPLIVAIKPVSAARETGGAQ